MTLRRMPFGYAVENGQYAVNEKEADIIRYIFNAYAEGKALQKVADELTARQVVFYEDKVVWNKSAVSRIIQDDRYAGEKEYPRIVSEERFEQVAEKRKAKGFVKKKQSETTQWLKTVCYCAQCGGLLYRRPKWATHEKWLCNNGCACAVYIDDAKILNGIYAVFRRIKENPELLRVDSVTPTYVRTQEIVRYTNEIGRMLNESSPSFAAGKKIIMESAAKKFCACTENTAAAYTDSLLREIAQAKEEEYLTYAFLKKTVDKIRVDENGNITVRYINGAEATSEER